MQIIEPSGAPEATYKAREVEGILDLYFYRKIGFWLAQFFARLNVTPAGVSLFGALCGVIAGHLYFYRNLSTCRSCCNGRDGIFFHDGLSIFYQKIRCCKIGIFSLAEAAL